jgi:hypothetical protein
VNNETEMMQKETAVDYGSVKFTGLQEGLPCSNSCALITYPISFVAVFRNPKRRLVGEYLEIHKETPLGFFLGRLFDSSKTNILLFLFFFF